MADMAAEGVVATFCLMVLSNILATKKAFGGKDNKELSDSNPTYVSPDGKTFAVWGLIYALETALVIAQLYHDEPTDVLLAQRCPMTGMTVRQRLMLAFSANAFWLPIFNNEYFWTALVVMAVYLGLLVSIYTDVNVAATSGLYQHICFAAGIAANTSWIVVAFCVSSFLSFGRAGWRSEHGVAGSVNAAIIAILLVAALACQRAIAIGDLAWAFVAAWALMGIYRMQTVPDKVRFPLGAMNSTLGGVARGASFVVMFAMLGGAALHARQCLVGTGLAQQPVRADSTASVMLWWSPRQSLMTRCQSSPSRTSTALCSASLGATRRLAAVSAKAEFMTDLGEAEPKAMLFHYYHGVGDSLEDAEQEAARKALAAIREADSEITRWLSWEASTSPQALATAAAKLADARPTDGLARKRLNQALRILHGRPILKYDLRYYTRRDEDSYHVVLRVPWQGKKRFFFEGSGLDATLAKESAAQAALQVVSQVNLKNGASKLELPRQLRARNVTLASLRKAALDEKVEPKIKLFQLMERVMERTGRKLARNDLKFQCRPARPDEAEDHAQVWQSPITEVQVTVPPLGPSQRRLRFTTRVPAWKKAEMISPAEAKRNPRKKKRYWESKAIERKSYLDAQQAVAAVAVAELVDMLPKDLFAEEAEGESQPALEAVASQ
ncbi:unnamed protein product [Effrenium voratum]|uniref:Uncharacterized protein n=1 Tax=Effrenium voratum TaxID=2562239 RepID=A0AA36MYP3_9DINO|nr:unnamed protein product [Effrenium voratum]